MRDTLVPYVCTALQASEQSKTQNWTELFANIRKTFENTNGLTRIFHNYRYLGLSRKQDKAQNYVFNLTYT